MSRSRKCPSRRSRGRPPGGERIPGRTPPGQPARRQGPTRGRTNANLRETWLERRPLDETGEPPARLPVSAPSAGPRGEPSTTMAPRPIRRPSAAVDSRTEATTFQSGAERHQSAEVAHLHGHRPGERHVRHAGAGPRGERASVSWAVTPSAAWRDRRPSAPSAACAYRVRLDEHPGAARGRGDEPTGRGPAARRPPRPGAPPEPASDRGECLAAGPRGRDAERGETARVSFRRLGYRPPAVGSDQDARRFPGRPRAGAVEGHEGGRAGQRQEAAARQLHVRGVPR